MDTTVNEQIKKLGVLVSEARVKKLSGGGYVFSGAGGKDFACGNLAMVNKPFEKGLQIFFENWDECEISLILKRPNLEKFAREEIKKKIFKTFQI